MEVGIGIEWESVWMDYELINECMGWVVRNGIEREEWVRSGIDREWSR